MSIVELERAELPRLSITIRTSQNERETRYLLDILSKLLNRKKVLVFPMLYFSLVTVQGEDEMYKDWAESQH